MATIVFDFGFTVNSGGTTLAVVSSRPDIIVCDTVSATPKDRVVKDSRRVHAHLRDP